MLQIPCPHCRSNNVSKTTMGKVTQGAASFAGGFLEGTVKTVADELISDGVGHLVPKFGESLAALAPVEYICHSCDALFNTTFYTDGSIKEIALKKSPMPDEIIESVRAEYIQTTRKKRPYVSAVVFALLTLYCLVFLLIGAVEGDGVRIAFSFFMAIPFAIPTVLKFKKISTLNSEIAECESQTTLDFKRSHRNLFTQYRQYH